MSLSTIAETIKRSIEHSPRNAYVAELHLQVLKHAEELEEVTGKEFCRALGLSEAFGTEFSKMKKIARRLRDAGLDPKRI